MQMSLSDPEFVNGLFDVVVQSLANESASAVLPFEKKVAILEAMDTSTTELEDGTIIVTYLFMKLTIAPDGNINIELDVNELLKYQQ